MALIPAILRKVGIGWGTDWLGGRGGGGGGGGGSSQKDPLYYANLKVMQQLQSAIGKAATYEPSGSKVPTNEQLMETYPVEQIGIGKTK